MYTQRSPHQGLALLPSDGVLLMHLIILLLGCSLFSFSSPRPPSSTKLSFMCCSHHCCTPGLLGSTIGIPGQASLFPHPSFSLLRSLRHACNKSLGIQSMSYSRLLYNKHRVHHLNELPIITNHHAILPNGMQY